ncbi:MAG: hypothetical protein J5620_03815 [Alphaproteobacteria bacterium]|nr:hypothetical protein [Alphaproteobacteria bacterium]
MTVTLATTFWMNIKYGFNIFSAAHWAYLSELQAYRTDIKLDFYISLILAIILGLVGLYFLARPKMRTFFIEPSQMPPPPQVDTPNIFNLQRSVESVKQQPDEQTAPRAPQINITRPMSPTGIPTPQKTPPKNNTVYVPAPKITPADPAISPHLAEISGIFEMAGYIIKPCTRIGKLIKPVVALSYDQTIWVCSENVSGADVLDALQTLIAVFDDTLGDTANDLTVRGCIINSPDSAENSELITTFGTTDEFQEFMTNHPNIKPADYDQDLFDAISTYIGTVTNYIGKQ